MNTNGFAITDRERSLFAARMTRPASLWVRALPGMTKEQRMEVFENYYRIADLLPQLPGGLTPSIKRIRENLFSFAWWTNDIVVDYHSRLKHRISKNFPPYGRPIAIAREKGKVPAMVNGVHVSVALQFGYRLAAPGAFVVVEQRPDFETYDFRFLAGLAVEILATGADVSFADWLSRRMAADGVLSVKLRRIDAPKATVEVLYDGSKPWKM